MQMLHGRFSFVLSMAFAVSVFSNASQVRADLMFFSETPKGFGQQLAAEEANHKNILFNQADLNLSGLMVEGYVNGTSSQRLQVGSSEMLNAAGGQAPAVRAADGAFSDAFFLSHDDNGNGFRAFQSLSFNIDMLLNAPSEAVVRVYDSNDSLRNSYTFNVANGNNFLGIIALDGESFGRAELFSNSAINRITQIRAGFVGMPFTIDDPQIFDLPPTVVSTPEASAWLVWFAVLLPWLVLRGRGYFRRVHVSSNVCVRFTPPHAPPPGVAMVSASPGCAVN